MAWIRGHRKKNLDTKREPYVGRKKVNNREITERDEGVVVLDTRAEHRVKGFIW